MVSLTQISYALALAEHGSFLKAAKASFVTQPTLSMQLQKLEDELGVILFDRSRKPIAPTQAGEIVLNQFRQVMLEYDKIKELLHEVKGEVSGDLRLGVIPTMAPFIVPIFLRPFLKRYPKVRLSIHEQTTDVIIKGLKLGHLDAGILATPLHDPQIIEEPIFDEPFSVYHSKELLVDHLHEHIAIKDLPMEQIVVMNEGHCLRTQVLDLCNLRDRLDDQGFAMETGSVATLLKIIDQGPYFTILPQMCLQDLPKRKYAQQVKRLQGSTPFREVGLVTYRRDLKRSVTHALTDVIRACLPEQLTAAASPPGMRLDP